MLCQAASTAVVDRRVDLKNVAEAESRVRRKRKLLKESKRAAKTLRQYYDTQPLLRVRRGLDLEGMKQRMVLMDDEEDIQKEHDALITKLRAIQPAAAKAFHQVLSTMLTLRAILL